MICTSTFTPLQKQCGTAEEIIEESQRYRFFYGKFRGESGTRMAERCVIKMGEGAKMDPLTLNCVFACWTRISASVMEGSTQRVRLSVGPVRTSRGVFGLARAAVRSTSAEPSQEWARRLRRLGFMSPKMSSCQSQSRGRLFFERNESRRMSWTGAKRVLQEIGVGLSPGIRRSPPDEFLPLPFAFSDILTMQFKDKNKLNHFFQIYLNFMRAYHAEADLHNGAGVMTLFHRAVIRGDEPSVNTLQGVAQNVCLSCLNSKKSALTIPQAPQRLHNLYSLLKTWHTHRRKLRPQVATRLPASNNRGRQVCARGTSGTQDEDRKLSGTQMGVSADRVTVVRSKLCDEDEDVDVEALSPGDNDKLDNDSLSLGDLYNAWLVAQMSLGERDRSPSLDDNFSGMLTDEDDVMSWGFAVPLEFICPAKRPAQ